MASFHRVGDATFSVDNTAYFLCKRQKNIKVLFYFDITTVEIQKISSESVYGLFPGAFVLNFKKRLCLRIF